MKGIAIGEMISVYNTTQNPLFSAIMFNATLRDEFAKRVEGGSVTNLYYDKLKNIIVTYPTQKEQVQIGSFFDKLDNLITLHHRMFSKLSLKIPNTWEQYKAVDLFISISNKNYPMLPVLSATQEFGMVKREDTGIDITHDKTNEKNYKKVNPGQFVIHLRSFQGGFAHSTLEGITSPAYTVFDFKNCNDHYDFFWKYIFNSDSFIKSLEYITYGVRDGRSISFSDFLTMKFLVPKFLEQKEIGQFFNKLDNLITLHQRKCKKGP